MNISFLISEQDNYLYDFKDSYFFSKNLEKENLFFNNELFYKNCYLQKNTDYENLNDLQSTEFLSLQSNNQENEGNEYNLTKYQEINKSISNIDFHRNNPYSNDQFQLEQPINESEIFDIKNISFEADLDVLTKSSITVRNPVDNINVKSTIPEKDGLSINEKKNYIKKKPKRKYFPDCLRKKIKVNHLRFLLNDFQKFTNSKKHFKKNVSSSISLTENKKFYSKKICEIFEENSYILNDKNFSNFKSRIECDGKHLKNLNLTLFEFIENFYYNDNYDFHEKDLKKIKEKEDDFYFEHYSYFDKNYLKYFKEEKPNKLRIDAGHEKTKKNSESKFISDLFYKTQNKQYHY